MRKTIAQGLNRGWREEGNRVLWGQHRFCLGAMMRHARGTRCHFLFAYSSWIVVPTEGLGPSGGTCCFVSSLLCPLELAELDGGQSTSASGAEDDSPRFQPWVA